MPIRKILISISFLSVLIGFCLPWLEFYGPVSGLGAVWIAIRNILEGRIFQLINSIILFSLIPILSGISLWHVFDPFENKTLAVMIVLLIDLTVFFAVHIILGFTGVNQIQAGFYIMSAGVLGINYYAIDTILVDRDFARQ